MIIKSKLKFLHLCDKKKTKQRIRNKPKEIMQSE